MMRRVYLVGFMGAGKTTVGRRLAKRLGWTFADTDYIAESELGEKLTTVFANKGELWFRKYERQVLHGTSELVDTVISTGGGTPCFYDNMDAILEKGLCFYLYLPPKAILSRLITSKKPRPLLHELTSEELEGFIETTLERRDPFYRRAHFIIDALSPDIVRYMEMRIREHFEL